MICFQPKTVEIIEKKIEILTSMWESGSISYDVKSHMARLATALHKRKCYMAHEIHLVLMMDYVSEVHDSSEILIEDIFTVYSCATCSYIRVVDDDLSNLYCLFSPVLLVGLALLHR